MPTLPIPFNMGRNTAKDRADLDPGELQTATGIYYKPGDPRRAHKIGGRSEFADTSSAVKVKGVALAQFDDGTDKVLALSGTVLYSATAGATGTFSSLKTGLSSNATNLSAAHFEDRWYIADGYDAVQAYDNDSGSLAIRDAGMKAPATPITATVASGTGTKVNFDASASVTGFTDAANGYDGSDSTYAYATLSAAGSSTLIYRYANAVATTTSSHTLYLRYRIAGAFTESTDSTATGGGGGVGVGGGSAAGWNVTFKVEVSENYTAGTPTWTTKKNETLTAAMPSPANFQVALTDSVDYNDIAVRVTFTYNSGTSQAQCQLSQAYFINAPAATITVTTGFKYAVTEYDQVRGLESEPGAVTAYVGSGTVAKITLTVPSSAENTNTTHLRVYRTTDGGSAPYQLGYIGEVAIGTTTFTDMFTTDKDAVGQPLLLMQKVTSNDGGDLYFPIHVPPPSLKMITAWKGSLVGIDATKKRTLRYSEAALPESWPELNAIEAFPLPEHDSLVTLVPLGDTLLVFAEGAVLRLSDLPRVVNGLFNAAEATAIRGAPGCVGVYAACAFSVAGEARAAWVSPYGIYQTNGDVVSRISDDMDWYADVSTANLSTAVLHWDAKRQVLIFAYDSDGGGTNDRFMFLHMSPEHRKGAGSPKITGPHYGAINHLASGQVSSVYRLYSAHVSDGSVYLEDYGTTDASQSYSSTTVPLIVKTGRIYQGHRKWDVVRANLRHTDFGGTETCTVAWSSGLDSSGVTQTTSKTVSLVGQDGEDFFVGLGGDWHEVQITHTGSASGALLDVRADTLAAGKSGKVTTT
jgi:hypothetical protein